MRVIVFCLLFLSPLSADAYVAKERYQVENELNLALQELLAIEDQIDPQAPAADLYANIAALFSLLEDDPWAIFYYEKSLLVEPRNRAVQEQLQQIYDRLHLENRVETKIFSRNELLSLCMIFLMIGFALLSLSLWRDKNSFLKWAVRSFAFSSLFFAFVLYNVYFTPIQAVAVRPSSLYLAPSFESSLLRQAPLMAGEKVNVVTLKEEGSWLQIMLVDGSIAFVPHTRVRILTR